MTLLFKVEDVSDISGRGRVIAPAVPAVPISGFGRKIRFNSVPPTGVYSILTSLRLSF